MYMFEKQTMINMIKLSKGWSKWYELKQTNY